MSLPAWDQSSLADLLSLDACGEGRWRSRFGDANLNGRSFGGQVLGQAMASALQDVPEDRHATMMQFLFLQGSDPAQGIEFAVTRLQDGKRFSSRHVRGRQGERLVADAHVSCATTAESMQHEAPSSAPAGERPTSLPTLDDLPPHLHRAIDVSGYSADRKPAIDFRIPDPVSQLDPRQARPRFRCWMKAHVPLGDGHRLHAAAFAYLSDWWLNFSALVPHIEAAAGRRLYIASLNHALWLHRPFRADEWMHVQTQSPATLGARGLSVAQVHDERGRLVASATQECVMNHAL